MSLKLADLLGSELLGRAVKVFSELLYCTEVRFWGLLGVITTLEFLIPPASFFVKGHKISL
jgi:hypothetical protein